MRIHCLQHTPLNTLGTIEEYAKVHDHILKTTRFSKVGTPPPAPDSFDLLIVMGDPMGIYDHAKNPWLKNEKAFLKKAIAAQKPVLGICLGAQLIADALGARVFENKYQERGWFPIRTSPAEEKPRFLEELPESLNVFHWHGNTFDLPEGAERLFESEACKNQGFLYAENVVGLQFHPEVTEERIKSLIARFREQIGAGRYIQKEEEMLGQERSLAESKKLLFSVLDWFEERV